MAECSQILLQINVVTVFLVSCLFEAAKSVIPLKRNLAERLGKKIDMLENADKAPKRGTATNLTSGFDAQIGLGFLFVLSSNGSLCVLVEGLM